jgi:hypothetical protein
VTVEKDQVRIGKDYLRFSINSTKPGYVYVLVSGPRAIYLLFPNAVDKNRVTPEKSSSCPVHSGP